MHTAQRPGIAVNIAYGINTKTIGCGEFLTHNWFIRLEITLALSYTACSDNKRGFMSSAEKIDNLSFEDALGQLENLVKTLERGEAPLEDSITAYERGMALQKHCEKKLRDAQAKIEKITVKQDGSVSAEPLDKKN
jgi:exodeoxyribonuclease VII small subunit